MTGISNIFACLVHENQECVIDLVRNLRFLDPASLILLYNGGQDSQLLDSRFPFERFGAVVHPQSRPQTWGRLHEFALDCMQFAADHFPFQTLTIVDSDQLAVRRGYSCHLTAFLNGRSRIGMLGNSPGHQPPTTSIGPAQAAYREIDLWRPLLRRFSDGENKFVHWSFWPSTVFTADAARELIQLFATDRTLEEIMGRTRIWASEEVILPTLVTLLGYEVVASPCSYEYVEYRANYTVQQIQTAQARRDVFWVHPVPRRYDDPLRIHIRSTFDHYENGFGLEEDMPIPETQPGPSLLLTWPILMRMKQIEGWLWEEEADLLIAAAAMAVTGLPKPHTLVEVGSYCGRSTIVLGTVAKTLCPDAEVHAIDPHDGKVGALDQGIQIMAPTLEKLKRNLLDAGLTEVVKVVRAYSWEVAWDKPISLLFIDGLHDYANVARDFYHFERWLIPGAYIAFHDYADYYPGVKTFVNELLRTGRYHRVYCAASMMVLRKVLQTEACDLEKDYQLESQTKPEECLPGQQGSPSAPIASVIASQPLVSCVMPTADRRIFVPQAIRYFQRQDYPNRELIILDDGSDTVADLIPPDPRIRYVHIAEKRTIGAKHNLACEMAEGEIIVHWDDDDWMANGRLSYQVEQLMRQSPMALCGLARVLFYEPSTNRAWEYVYPSTGLPWVSGATFCYRKEFWERHRFPSMNEGGDTAFVWRLKDAKVFAHSDHMFYVAIVHPKNTSSKRTSDSRWHAYPTQGIRELMQGDMAFYTSISG